MISKTSLSFSIAFFIHPQIYALDFQSFLQKSKQNSQAIAIARSKQQSAQLKAEIASYNPFTKLQLQSSLSGAKEANANTSLQDANFSKNQGHQLQLSLPLFDFGKQWATENAALKRRDESDLDLQLEHQNLAIFSAEYFENAIYNFEIVKKTKEQLNIAKEKLTNQTKNFQQGLKPEADLISAKLDFTRAELNAQRAENEFKIAIKNLRFLMAEDIQNAPPLSLSYDFLTSADIEQIMSRHASKNFYETYEIKKLNLEAQALDLELKSIDKNIWPSLSSTLRASEQGQLSPLYPRLEAALQLTWELPVTGKHFKDQDANRSAKTTVELSKQKLIDDTKLELHLNLARLKQLAVDSSTLKNQVELAQKQKILITKRYQNGAASALDLSIADNQLVTLELEYLKNNHDTRLKAIEITQIIGEEYLPQLFKR